MTQSRSAPPDRDAALTLLAADALITLAVELEAQDAGNAGDAATASLFPPPTSPSP